MKTLGTSNPPHEPKMSAGPPRIFDPQAYRLRRERAARLGADIFLVQDVAGHLAERLGAINRHFARGLDVHSREAVFPTLQPFADSWVRTGFAWDRPSVIANDEFLPFGENSFDVVTSVLSLHAVNDLPGTLVQIRRVLKPDGVFIAGLFGGETLHELKLAFAAAEVEILSGASPRVSPFGDVRELGGLLQRVGFALPVAEFERTIGGYRDIARLFADLRALGETNVLVGRRSQFLSGRFFSSVPPGYALP